MSAGEQNLGDVWVLRNLDPSTKYGIFLGNGQGVVHRESCADRWGYPAQRLSAATIAALFTDVVAYEDINEGRIVGFCGNCVVRRKEDMR